MSRFPECECSSDNSRMNDESEGGDRCWRYSSPFHFFLLPKRQSAQCVTAFRARKFRANREKTTRGKWRARLTNGSGANRRARDVIHDLWSNIDEHFFSHRAPSRELRKFDRAYARRIRAYFPIVKRNSGAFARRADHFVVVGRDVDSRDVTRLLDSRRFRSRVAISARR